MTINKKIIFAPAKLNIFLKILGRRVDGLHSIRSGITFINLYDKIFIEKNNKTKILYSGLFKPSNDDYNDCIILKTINALKFKNDFKFKIEIEKNIPVQGGLGSASTNAASIISFFQKSNFIEYKKPKYYSFLGSDIPCFLYKKNCLITGTGEIVSSYPFPKYYFLLVKPKNNNSTKEMYNKLLFKTVTSNQEFSETNFDINENDYGNDFEERMMKDNLGFKGIFEYLENIENAIFTRMTGSGSCCYVVFKKKEHAIKANKIFKLEYPDLWSIVCENNKDND